MWTPQIIRLGLLVSDGDVQAEQLIKPGKLGHQVLDCPPHVLSRVKSVLVYMEKNTHLCDALSFQTVSMGTMDLPSDFPDACLSISWFKSVWCHSVEVRFTRNYLRKKGRSPFFGCGLRSWLSIYCSSHILLVKDTEFIQGRHSLPPFSRWCHKELEDNTWTTTYQMYSIYREKSQSWESFLKREDQSIRIMQG